MIKTLRWQPYVSFYTFVGFGVTGSALAYRSERAMHGATLFQKLFGDKA